MPIYYVDLNGEKISRREYCKRLGYSYRSICTMMSKYKLSFEDATIRYLNTKRRTIFDEKMKDRRLRKKWLNMKDRCENVKNPSFYYYGGRGIKVCERWLDYYNFQDDMLESYQKHVKEYGEKDTTLDRIDVNGNYCLENCRWSTKKEQANNKTTNTMINNELTAKQFSEIHKLPYNVLLTRLNSGWTVEKILNTPVETHSKRTILSTGETIPQFARRVNISVSTVKRYLNIGYTLEEISLLHINKYLLPCGMLKAHCDRNNYPYFSIVQSIKYYNLTPHEALARYLKTNKNNC